MESIGDSFRFLAGAPGILGLLLAAATILVTSDWRLALSALLVQYVFLGITLTRFIPPEAAFIRILVGALAVPILYLSAQQAGNGREVMAAEGEEQRFLGLPMGWAAGPLGLPLRLLTVMLTGIAVIQFYPQYPSLLPSLVEIGVGATPDVALVALWLIAMGIIGIVLSGQALRVAPALLTILCGFDLVYAGLDGNLAIAGFFAALSLLAALAFSYLATVQTLAPGAAVEDEDSAR